MTNPVDSDPSPECDSGQPLVRDRFDPADPEEPAMTVINALAAVRNVPATELTPLYDSVDLESVGRLLDHACEREVSTTVGFSAAGYGVRISSDGTIVVCDDGRGVGRSPECVEASD